VLKLNVGQEVAVLLSAMDRVSDREITGLTVSFREPLTVTVADEVLDCEVELVSVPECVEVLDCEELPENVAVPELVLDCWALLVYVTVPVIVAVSVGLTDGPGAAETEGVTVIVTDSVLERRGVAETHADAINVLLSAPVIVKVELEDGETVFLIVPVGLVESLRLLVILGVTVEHVLAVEVLLAINDLVSVLVPATDRDEVPVDVCDLVRGAERERVEDALDVFDCVIDRVPLDEPVEVFVAVTELVPVRVTTRVLVAT
jgi:hypothetical protein